jgi:cyclic pyranopterin phosphate synthase
MPPGAQFLPSSECLRAQELVEICSRLVDFGIDEIRISGGEPTIRKDFDEIVRGLSDLPLKKLGVTTNGFCLQEKLPVLKNTLCQHINVSLDSLDEERFRTITKANHFKNIYRGVLMAQEMGFKVKVNVVLMREVNDHEIFDFLEFSRKHDIEVRFLELMKIGCARLHHERHFIPAKEIIKEIEERHQLIPRSVNIDSTAFNFVTDHGAKIGFIASESQPFCGFCSRLRLTATGILRSCLMVEHGINLRGKDISQYPDILRSVIARKPMERLEKIDQPMYQIGG